MNEKAGVGTEPCGTVLRRKEHRAAFALLHIAGPARQLNVLATTRYRAVFDRPPRCSTAGKRKLAMGTERSAATCAQFVSGATWLEVRAALPALIDSDGIGVAAERHQVWVISPERAICCAVTGRAQRLQVIQAIRFEVIIEKMIGPPMVDGHHSLGSSAVLAGSLISAKRGCSLAFPVGASIPSETAAPRWIVGSRPLIRRTPHSEARSRAKVPILHGARSLIERLPARVTGDVHSISPPPHVVGGLPLAIAGEPAEVPLRNSSHVGLDRVRLAALITSQRYRHVYIVPRNVGR